MKRATQSVEQRLLQLYQLFAYRFFSTHEAGFAILPSPVLQYARGRKQFQWATHHKLQALVDRQLVVKDQYDTLEAGGGICTRWRLTEKGAAMASVLLRRALWADDPIKSDALDGLV